MKKQKGLFKKGSILLRFIFAIVTVSCVSQINDEIRESNISIFFVAEAGKGNTKITKNIFETGDRMGVFAMLIGNGLSEQRYIDNLFLECGEGTTPIPKREVFYPEGNVTLDSISYYPCQTAGMGGGSSLLHITAQADQNKSSNYSSSDFVTARTESVANSREAVKLTYKYQFVKIRIVLTPKDGENVDNMLKANPWIIATGFRTQTLYDLQSDELSEVDEESETDTIPSGVWKEIGNGLSGKELIAIPQTHSDSKQAFSLEWNGEIYACSLPSAIIKEDTELGIQINALQSASESLTGVIANIKEWGASEQGDSENEYDITAIHTASPSLKASGVYRVYRQGKPVAETCREYLHTPTDGAINSKTIMVYLISDNGRTDLSNGTVLQLPDKTAAMYGGKVSWNETNNSLAYTGRHSGPIEKLYIDGDLKIVTEKSDKALTVNVGSYTIRDIRNGIPQSYPTVKIGTQYWMREDLQTACYNGSKNISIQKILGTGDRYFRYSVPGFLLYNGEAVLIGKLAPLGWRIPSGNNWNRLKEYIAGSAPALKKTGTWSSDANPVINETGFGIAPKRLLLERDNATALANPASSTAYWTRNGMQEQLDKVVIITNSNNDIEFKNSVKSEGRKYYNGLSVRCTKE